MTFKGALSSALLLASSWTTEAFTPGPRPVSFQPTTTHRAGSARTHGSLSAADEKLALTKLNMFGKKKEEEVAEVEVVPIVETKDITPEGFGFSSPIVRILDVASRSGGYYSAKTSNLVTDVMDEITGGNADVALVFEDGEDGKLAGIFTETDYIEVRLENSCYGIALVGKNGLKVGR